MLQENQGRSGKGGKLNIGIFRVRQWTSGEIEKENKRREESAMIAALRNGKINTSLKLSRKPHKLMISLF